jgi:hypothetical protein
MKIMFRLTFMPCWQGGRGMERRGMDKEDSLLIFYEELSCN